MRNPVSPNRDRFLAAWARAVTARPWLTILFFLIVAALCAAYTAKDLHFKSDRSDLVDPNTPWQKRYADYKAADPRWDDAVVVVDLTSAHAPAPESFIAELESRLRADPAHFKAVTAGFDRESAPPGLIYTASLAQVKDATDSLKRTAPVLASTTFPELLGLSTLAGNKLPPDQRAELAALLTRAATIAQIANEPRASASGTLDSTTTTAQSPSPSASDRPQAASRKPHPAPSLLGLDQLSGTQRLTSSTGKLATILVSLVPSDKGSTQGIANREDSLRALRAILSDLHRDARFTALRAGVTGVPVLESDETVLSRRDASFASAISLTLIALLMLIVYRGVIVPLFAVIALMVGMAMSFAWATLAVGHLQLLSVTFASMLLGLGIDVAIHIIARLELVHPDHDHLRAGFEETYRGVGPGILTASITVAAACGAMAFTPFAGVGELGIIAAGGMVLCTIAVMSLFPALMMVIRKPESRLRAHEGGVSRPFMGRFGVTVHRRPAVVLTVAAIVMAASGWLGTRVRYDPDLLKLMPSTTESVVWQNELERDDARSVWHAIVVAHTPKEALDTTLKLRALPEVAEVGGAGILFQSEADITAKRDLLRSLPDPKLFPPASSPQRTPSVSEGRPQQRTPSGSEGRPEQRTPSVSERASEQTVSERADSPTPSQPPNTAPASDPPQAASPKPQAAALRGIASSIAAAWKNKDDHLHTAAAALANLSDDQLARVNAAYTEDRAKLIGAVAALRSAEPPAPSELPTALKDTLLGDDNAFILRVYPAAGADPNQSPLAPERLGPFARAVLAAAPTATGPTVQIYESTRLITDAYLRAGLYALAAICLILLLDFGFTRSGVLDTLCALTPVIAGSVLLLALMALLDIDLNFANMIVMPLIAGIGVGCGVHALRRWRIQPDDEPYGLAGGSGRGMTLTTLTTVIGFAAMTIAEHRGIRSLGLVMSAGLTTVWVATILVVPSLLKVRRAMGW